MSLPSPDEAPGISPPSLDCGAVVETPRPPVRWASMGYLHLARLVPQELLLGVEPQPRGLAQALPGSYPFVSCSQPADQAHRCFQPGDFIVSVPLRPGPRLSLSSAEVGSLATRCRPSHPGSLLARELGQSTRSYLRAAVAQDVRVRGRLAMSGRAAQVT